MGLLRSAGYGVFHEPRQEILDATRSSHPVVSHRGPGNLSEMIRFQAVEREGRREMSCQYDPPGAGGEGGRKG